MPNYTARYRLVIELEVDTSFSCPGTPQDAQDVALAYLKELSPDKFDWKTQAQMVSANPTLYALDKDKWVE